MSEILELEIASPVAAAQHASTELAAPIERTTALFAPFAAPFAKAAELLLQESTANDAGSARVLRLKIVKARTEIGRTKDAAKADVKLVGQVIDWYHRKGAEQCEQAEARLLEIEEAEKRAEAARKKALTEERSAALERYGVDSTFFQLADMPDALFAKLLDTSRAGFEAKAAAESKRIEDARLAAEKIEADRIAKQNAEAEERERVRIENERLKREADERAAPDRDKLVAFGKLVRTLELPAMATMPGKHAAANIRDLIDDLGIQIDLAVTKLGGKRAGHAVELPGMLVAKGGTA